MFTYDTKNLNPEEFLIDLYNQYSNFFCNDCNLNQQFEHFVYILRDAFNKHAPLRKKSKKERKLSKRPWITKDILQASKIKSELYKGSLNGTTEDLQRYKSFRNKLAHDKEQAKQKFYTKTIYETKHNIKHLWTTINDIAKYKTKAKGNIAYLVNNQEEKITEPTDIANTFNTFFSTVGQRLASSIEDPGDLCTLSCTSLIPQQNNFFYLKPITLSEVLMYLQQLNPAKSPGPNGIPLKYIRMSAQIIAPILAKLFNSCIQSGTYPEILKISQNIPLFKSGAKDQCCNYKPISLLSPISKIFEKCLYERLYSYFEKNKILSPQQFGFKQNSSTSDAVRQLHNIHTENLDSKKSTCSVFLDLKKAFDTVDHSILLKKFERYGVRGLPLQILQSYLCNRYHYTEIINVKSSYSPVKRGVSQGSTLGPLMFLIYVNDLPMASNLDTKLFADDTVLTMLHQCLTTLRHDINEELRKIDNWMKINKLSINYAKTKSVLVTAKKNPINMNIRMENMKLNKYPN